MKSAEVTLSIEQGMHMRPAGVLAGVAGNYPCDITLEVGEKKINAKSIMLILAAGIKEGTTIRVICEGEGEDRALEAVCSAIEGGLGE